MRVAVLGLLGALALFAGEPALGQSKIEYASVAEARAALLAKPGAKSRDEGGWLVVSDGNVMWTFAPEAHEANPAVARREIVEQDGKLFLHMEIGCEAAKEACDRLKQSFDDLNARMMKAMEDAAKGQQ